MYKKVLILSMAMILGFSSLALARFTGPSISGAKHSVSQIANLRVGSYVTLTGNIIAHQRGDYYTFRDSSGTIRVEIENDVWQGRDIGPETRVEILGEVDRSPSGRYIWVKSLSVLP